MSKLKVPIGPTTIAGYGVTVTSVLLAVLAYLQGDRSDQTLGVIVAGAVALVSFAITQIGRYVQAKALAERAPLGVTQNFALPAVKFSPAIHVAGPSLEADDDQEPEPSDTMDHDARELAFTGSPPPDTGDIGAVPEVQR